MTYRRTAPGLLEWQQPCALLMLALCLLSLAACNSLPQAVPAPDGQATVATVAAVNPTTDRHVQKQDSVPPRTKNVSRQTEPTPKKEPRSPRGNSDTYTVSGVTYHVLPSAKGYDQVGIASWYGSKFHGYRTSSGEPYNMYRFTAAHRTLPLPTYARVTNLENGKSVVVRINDRGPFHRNRLIDLSWAAAVRLDMTQKGTARVRVEALTAPGNNAEQPDSMSTAVRAALDTPPPEQGQGQSRNTGLYLQAGAFRTLDHARQLEKEIRTRLRLPVTVHQPDEGALYKVRLGPFATRADRKRARETVHRSGFTEPIPTR